MNEDIPQGFILSDAALYSFMDQDVFPDLISFAAAIPDHLKPLFLIPIRLETASSKVGRMASHLASLRIGDGAIPTGDTPEGDLFGVKTFVYDDNEPTIPQSTPGSIFEVDGADERTHHQEDDQDENIQVPTDTSYMEDVDMTQYWDYPYRTKEKPVRHSSRTMVVRISLKPDELESKAPTDVKDRARTCSVSLVSYDKRGRVFTFSVNCGNRPHNVRAAMTDLDHVAVNCDCEFWQWNGPEFHAKENAYMLGSPRGTASPPDIRDPDRKYYLCKHTYAILTRLDHFVQEMAEENEDLDEQGLLLAVDQNWDRLEGVTQIPLEEIEDEDIEVDWESDEEFVEEEEIPVELSDEFEEEPVGEEPAGEFEEEEWPVIEFTEEPIEPEELKEIERLEAEADSGEFEEEPTEEEEEPTEELEEEPVKV
jgi:hypothetical protein